MDNLDYWRICDKLNVVQTALLIIGEDPTETQKYVSTRNPSCQVEGYHAVETALINSILLDELPALIEYEQSPKRDAVTGNVYFDNSDDIDLKKTLIDVDDIRSWLLGRGITDGFFFVNRHDNPDYLNPNHPRYAPKLAASINAWLSMEDEEKLKGTTAKQALIKWLREHATEYRLSDVDGNLNEKGIEECAKISNWKEKGGAPKTPS